MKYGKDLNTNVHKISHESEFHSKSGRKLIYKMQHTVLTKIFRKEAIGCTCIYMYIVEAII